METDGNLKKLGQLFQVLALCLREISLKTRLWFAVLSRIHLISSSWCCKSISDVNARVMRRNLAKFFDKISGKFR